MPGVVVGVVVETVGVTVVVVCGVEEAVVVDVVVAGGVLISLNMGSRPVHELLDNTS